ncbi:MAG TPA: peptidylprolyl isomerase [Chthonomonadaceae bacterium]|nr:peptidylprolyl isomerase [Chthonomonadaceae bacterium]
MNPTLRPMARLCAGAASLTLLGLLSGCTSQDKDVVAWVGNEPIRKEEFYPRVMAVSEIPQGFTSDAGALTLVNMIRDRLTDQLAAMHHAQPTKDLVDQAVAYDVRMSPETEELMVRGRLTQKDLFRQKRYEMETFGIGTDGDNPSDADIDKVYEEYKNRPEFTFPASYTARVLEAPDDATARKIIADVKQTGDFKAAAMKFLNAPAMTAEIAAKERRLRATQLAPEQYQPLRDALEKLKPNEITSEPVAFKVPDPNQPLTSTFKYYVVQLKSKDPEQKLTKDEMMFLLRPLALQKTHPGWKEHYVRQLADYYKMVQSNIHIELPQYEGLPEAYIRPLVNAGVAQASGAAPAQAPANP